MEFMGKFQYKLSLVQHSSQSLYKFSAIGISYVHLAH